MKEREKQEESRFQDRLLKTVAAFFFCLLFGYLLTSCTSSVQEKQKTESPFKPLPELADATDAMEGVDFSKFRHDNERHRTIPCLMCHQTNEESPKPKFASHTPCIGCHAQQFKDDSHPICMTCHTEPNSDKLKAFPAMTTFKVNFNHTAHFKEANCATCHKTEGGSMTIPARSAAHETCFQCHKTDKVVNDKNIGTCSTCHEPGTPNRISVETTDAGFNFSHAKHGGLNCASCHSPAGGNQMSAINVAMHSGAANSCATCHNNQRAFGANDFTDCRKCHTEVASARTFGIKFDHSDHAKKDCATCHKTGGSGISFSVPNGEAAHKTCFQCHSPMKGGGSFTTSKCFQCHQVNGTNDIAPPPTFVAGNFSHTKHNFFECDSCHTTSGGKMDVPSVAMHKPAKSGTSCATCHNNETAFGEDFTNCKRCHTGGKFKFK